MPADNKQFGPAPKGLLELIYISRQQETPCTCKEHDPEGYFPTKRCKHEELLVPHRHDTRSSPMACFWCEGGHRYEALDLVEYTTRCFSRSREVMDSVQVDALNAWQNLDRSHNGVLQKLGWADGARALAPEEVMSILQIFNDIFFSSAINFKECKWNNEWDAKSEWVLLGLCTTKRNNLSTIEISSINTGRLDATGDLEICEARAVRRLETLLHECVHAYLDQYACRTCRRYDVNYKQAGRHGRAFHRLASALENVSGPLLGVRLSLCTWCQIAYSWPDVRSLPSEHDMAEWNWSAGQ